MKTTGHPSGARLAASFVLAALSVPFLCGCIFLIGTGGFIGFVTPIMIGSLVVLPLTLLSLLIYVPLRIFGLISHAMCVVVGVAIAVLPFLFPIVQLFSGSFLPGFGNIFSGLVIFVLGPCGAISGQTFWLVAYASIKEEAHGKSRMPYMRGLASTPARRVLLAAGVLFVVSTVIAYLAPYDGPGAIRMREIVEKPPTLDI